MHIWSSWIYSHENGPLRSNTSVSSSIFYLLASIIKATEAFFNKTNKLISYNMYAVAMDTTTKPF